MEMVSNGQLDELGTEHVPMNQTCPKPFLSQTQGLLRFVISNLGEQ